MLGKVHVLDPEIWLRFENNEPLDPNKRPLTPVEHGEELFVKRACKGCHSIDGVDGIGPSFKGLFGKTETLTDGSTVLVDDNYIMESINNPDLKIVKDFVPGQMPSFEGQLSQEDIADIITYIKTLK